MTNNPAIGIARVDDNGRILHLNAEAKELLGPCEGFGCASAMRARCRDQSSACAECIAMGGVTETQHLGEVALRDQHARLSCSRVGNETIVVIEPLDIKSWNDPLTPREREAAEVAAE